MNTPAIDILRALLIAGSLGALIGLARQVRHEEEISAGLRTFALWSCLGCLGAYFNQAFPWFFIAGFLTVATQLTTGHYLEAKKKKQYGLTTEAAGLVTYLVGGLVWYKQIQVAVSLSIAVAIILAAKKYFTELLKKFTESDIRAALLFAVLSGIILPVVPNRTMGPYNALNPQEAWLMVVLVSGIGFAGYVAVRVLGASRGILLTGLLGGLASSTATTLALSRRSKDSPEMGSSLAFAVVLACTVMLPRLFLTLGVINPSLARHLILPLSSMVVVSLIFAVSFYRQEKGDSAQEPLNIGNPLALGSALKFGLLYSVIVVASKAALEELPTSAIYAISFLAGLTDVDAISLSMARLARNGELSEALALQAVLIAAVSNTLLKIGFVVILGAPHLAKKVSLALGVTAMAGIGWVSHLYLSM